MLMVHYKKADDMTKFSFNEQSRDLCETWTKSFSPNLSFPLSSISMFAFKISLVLGRNLKPV